MHRVRTAGLAGLVLGVALVACSSSSSSSTPTPSPSPTASPTPPASAAASAAVPSFALPSNAKELEALLPDTLGGKTLTKASMRGSDFVNQSSQNPELVTWLNSLGKSLSDISAAYAFDLSGTTQTFIFAFRVNGVDHSTLVSTMKTASAGSGTPQTWTTANVGGKSVETSASTDGTNTTYLYGAADVIFMVSSADAATAAEALSKLP